MQGATNEADTIEADPICTHLSAIQAECILLEPFVVFFCDGSESKHDVCAGPKCMEMIFEGNNTHQASLLTAGPFGMPSQKQFN